MPGLTLINLGWDDVLADYRGIHVRWQPSDADREETRFKVLRAEAEYFYDSGTTPPQTFIGLAGDWEDITPADLNAGGVGHHGFIDTPAIRKSYAYKLEAYDILTDELKGFSNFENARVFNTPYNNWEYPAGLFIISANSGYANNVVLPPTERFKAYANRIRFTALNPANDLTELKRWLSDGESLRIYRAPIENRGTALLPVWWEIGPYEVVKDISSAELDNFQFYDTPADGPGHYRYEWLFVRDDKPSVTGVNRADHIASIATGDPSLPVFPEYLFQWNKDGASSTFKVTESDPTDVLAGARLLVFTFGVNTKAEWDEIYDEDYDDVHHGNIEPNWGKPTTAVLSAPEISEADGHADYTTGAVPTTGAYGGIEVYYVDGEGEMQGPIFSDYWEQ